MLALTAARAFFEAHFSRTNYCLVSLRFTARPQFSSRPQKIRAPDENHYYYLSLFVVSCKQRTAAYSRSRRDAVTSRRDGRATTTMTAAMTTTLYHRRPDTGERSGRAAADARAADDRLARPRRSAVRPAPVSPPPTVSTRRPAGRPTAWPLVACPPPPFFLRK